MWKHSQEISIWFIGRDSKYSHGSKFDITLNNLLLDTGTNDDDE